MRYIALIEIFPAYAGVNPSLAEPLLKEKDLPRVCGGEPDTGTGYELSSRSSPRMRG